MQKPEKRLRKMDDQTCCIVLIDDMQLDRSVFIRSLHNARISCTVREFENPLDALAYLQGLENTGDAVPSLIVTDITMPEMNGYDLIRAIRQIPLLRDVPLAVFTSYSPDNTPEIAHSAGADIFLVKPLTGIQITELVVLLNRHGSLL